MRGHGTARTTCERCGEEFACYPSQILRGIRFCSRSCQATHQQFTCLECGTLFGRRESAIRKGETKFCGRPCFAASKIGRFIPAKPRFEARIQKTATCWLWTGANSGAKGYGTIDIDGQKEASHRYAYAQASGEILTPDDVIGHTCDTPACVRNDEQGIYKVRGESLPRWGHLFKGTHAHNQHDKVDKGRQARGDSSGRRTKPQAWQR